jgi:restriction endonuclease Mrr
LERETSSEHQHSAELAALVGELYSPDRTLAELMIDHDPGVSPMANYDVKRIDADYFTE